YLRRRTLAARLRQVPRGVEDPLLAVCEGAAHIDAGPGAGVTTGGQLLRPDPVPARQAHLAGGRFEAPAEGEGRGGEHGGAVLEDRSAHRRGDTERRDLDARAPGGLGVRDGDDVILRWGGQSLADVDDLLQARADRLARPREGVVPRVLRI